MARKGRRKRGKRRENISKHNLQLKKKKKEEKKALAENMSNKYDYILFGIFVVTVVALFILHLHLFACDCVPVLALLIMSTCLALHCFACVRI